MVTTNRLRGSDRLLNLAAAALLVAPSWLGWPVRVHAPVIAGVSAVAAAFALLAAVPGVRGGALGFALLWGAFGMALSLSLLGLLAIGLVYPAAALLLVGAVATAPNRTGGSRAAAPYLLAGVVGFLVVLAPLFAL